MCSPFMLWAVYSCANCCSLPRNMIQPVLPLWKGEGPMVHALTGECGKVSRGCFEGHEAGKSSAETPQGSRGGFSFGGRMLMRVWNRELILVHLKDWCRHWWTAQMCSASGKPSECLQSPPTKELRRDRTFTVHTADFLWSLSFLPSQSCLATPVHTHTHTAVINHIATPGCAIPVTGLHMDENTAGALHQYSRIALCVETRARCILIQGPAQKCINGFLPF